MGVLKFEGTRYMRGFLLYGRAFATMRDDD